jgi:hypothetical protein
VVVIASRALHTLTARLRKLSLPVVCVEPADDGDDCRWAPLMAWSLLTIRRRETFHMAYSAPAGRGPAEAE